MENSPSMHAFVRNVKTYRLKNMEWTPFMFLIASCRYSKMRAHIHRSTVPLLEGDFMLETYFEQ